MRAVVSHDAFSVATTSTAPNNRPTTSSRPPLVVGAAGARITGSASGAVRAIGFVTVPVGAAAAPVVAGGSVLAGTVAAGHRSVGHPAASGVKEGVDDAGLGAGGVARQFSQEQGGPGNAQSVPAPADTGLARSAVPAAAPMSVPNATSAPRPKKPRRDVFRARPSLSFLKSDIGSACCQV